MRRPLADRPVVAARSLLAGVGVERRGRLTRNVQSVNRGVCPGRKREEHADVASQAVRDSQVDGVGGVPAGCGQRGCPWGGRAGSGGVRGRSEESAVPDLESDELGVLLSASGQGGGDSQAAWRWGPYARCAARTRPASPRRRGRFCPRAEARCAGYRVSETRAAAYARSDSAVGPSLLPPLRSATNGSCFSV
jgi:hypothetical protein